MKRGIIVVLVLGVMFGTASIASAQVRTTGVIQGRTVDQDGVPVPGVMITVNSPSLMGTQTVYSASLFFISRRYDVGGHRVGNASFSIEAT